MTYKNSWHVAHALLSLFTGGLWLIIWLWRASSNNKFNRGVDKQIQLEQNETLKRIARLLEKQLEEIK
jgi:hypothetical protein